MASVDEILNNAKEYADSLQTEAAQAVASTLSRLSYPHPVIPRFNYIGRPTITASKYIIPDISVPRFEPPDPDAYLPQDADAFREISEIDLKDLPEFSADKPTITMPDKPSALDAFVLSAPPINTNFTLPDDPNTHVVSAPTIADRTQPAKPSITLPSFSGTIPSAAAIPRGMDPETVEAATRRVSNQYMADAVSNITPRAAAYVEEIAPGITSVLGTSDAQLATYLRGGTGLAPAVENAIYERSRSKVDAESERIRSTILNDIANRGFTLPNGALSSAIVAARQAAADNNARAASEITVMQAEMEQKNLQFAVTTLAGMRATLLNATQAYLQSLVALNAQSLDAAKSVLSTILAAYDSQAKLYGLQLEVFRAHATLYETEAKAATLALEIYRGELAAFDSSLNHDKTRVELYRSQIEAAGQEIGLYKEKVNAVVSKANLEKLKIDLVGMQAQLYATTVQAKEAEWRGYTAAVQGEEAKARIFATEVEGFKAQVDVLRTDISAQAERIKAEASANAAISDRINAKLAIFNALMQSATTKVSTETEIKKLKLAAAVEQLKAALGIDTLKVDVMKAETSLATERERLGVEAGKANVDAEIAYMQAVANVSTITAQTLSGMAQAAMSGMNVLAAQTETI